MKFFKAFILILVLTLSGSNFSYAQTTQSDPCKPLSVKPEYQGTGIGKFYVKPEIVAVGQNITLTVESPGGNEKGGGVGIINLYMPENTDLVDYSPRTLTGVDIKPGQWTASKYNLPGGTYTLTVKVSHWTNYKWAQAKFAAQIPAGTGPGTNYFYAYYDTIPMEISMDDRDLMSEKEKEVVREITVKTVPEVRITLTTDKGEIGSSSYERSGKNATSEAGSTGEAKFYLYAKSGDKVKLSATSPDSCKKNTQEETFTIPKATNSLGKESSWWDNFVGTLSEWSYTVRKYIPSFLIPFSYDGALVWIVIIALIIYFLREKKKKEESKQSTPQNPPSPPVSNTMPPSQKPANLEIPPSANNQQPPPASPPNTALPQQEQRSIDNQSVPPSNPPIQ